MVNITALGAMILLSCKGMFEGEVPDSTIITAFQNGKYGTNGTEIVKQTVIGSASTNVSVFKGDFTGFRIQYTKEDGKDVFGGHIMNDKDKYCPVNGEDDQMNTVRDEDFCDQSPYYKLGNELILINKKPKLQSQVYTLDGTEIEPKKFIANVDCAKNSCGFDAVEKVVVDHDGNCFSFGNTGDWSRQKCSAIKIKVESGETSHPFNLRYLSIVYKCQVKPPLKESELDNIYISFVQNPRANGTVKNEKGGQSDSSIPIWAPIAGGVLAFCLLLVVALVVYCAIKRRKKKTGKTDMSLNEKEINKDIKGNQTLEEPQDERIAEDHELDDLSIEEVDEKKAVDDQDLRVKIPRKLHKTDKTKKVRLFEKPEEVTEREEIKLKPRVERPLPEFKGPRAETPKVSKTPVVSKIPKISKVPEGSKSLEITNLDSDAHDGRTPAGKSARAATKKVKGNITNMAKADKKKKNKDNVKGDDKDNVKDNADDNEEDKQVAGTPPIPDELAKKQRKKKRRELLGTPGKPVVYEMVDRIGKGSFGVIYRYEMGGNRFAVKFFRTDDVQSLKRAKSIYRAFKRISHKEKLDLLVDYVDIGRTRDTTYLIMPWYGENMEKMNMEGMKLAQKFNLIYHYFQPIKQLQSRNIAHLSIKPKNYLRKLGTNQLILTELGNARRFGTKRKQVIGTLTYMSATTHNCRPVSIMDDLQSWFIMCAEILKPPLPWKDVVVAGDKDYMKVLSLKKCYLDMLTPDVDSREFLVELREELWDKDYNDDPDINRIVKIMEDFQSLYKFNFNEPWEGQKPDDNHEKKD